MKGHIRQRTKGSWEIAIDIGRDASTGRRLRHSESVRGRKADAQKRLAELLISVQESTFIKPRRIRLSEWLATWLSGCVKMRCSQRTVEGYETIIRRHLGPGLGGILLAELKPEHIQKFYASLLSHGRLDGKGGLSTRSVLHIHRVLFAALGQAVKQGLLVRNVAQFVDAPRAKRTRFNTLTPEGVARLLEVSRDTPYYPVIAAAVNTGLREAELLGLRWRDVDLELASLSVAQVLYKRHGVCEFKEPKTEHSKRQVALTPSLSLFLQLYKEEKKEHWLLCGKQLGEDDLLFARPDGLPMDPGTLTHAFAKITRKAGLRHIRFHDLRHTHASLMLASGVHPKIVQERLGHSTIAVTIDTYSHVVPGLQEAAALRFDEFINLGQAHNVGKMSARTSDPDSKREQGWQDSNPRPAVLETAALPN